MRTFRSAIIWIAIFLIIGIGILLLIASQLSNSNSNQEQYISNGSIEFLELESQFSNNNIDSFEENGGQGQYPMKVKQRAIEQFKMKTKNSSLSQKYMNQNTYISRWIIDQEGDVEKAVEKFEQSLQWRKENKVDEVIDEDFSDILVHCPFEIQGFDKKGNSIAHIPLGTWQLNKVLVAGKLERLYRAEYFMLENHTRFIEELSNQTGKMLKMFGIVDFSGFSYRTHACFRCIPLMTQMGIIYESYYPEFGEKAIFINVPRIAHTFLNLIMPFLSKRTNDLVEMFGYDKEEWSEALLKYIDEDQLQEKYKNIPSTKDSSWWGR